MNVRGHYTYIYMICLLILLIVCVSSRYLMHICTYTCFCLQLTSHSIVERVRPRSFPHIAFPCLIRNVYFVCVCACRPLSFRGWPHRLAPCRSVKESRLNNPSIWLFRKRAKEMHPHHQTLKTIFTSYIYSLLVYLLYPRHLYILNININDWNKIYERWLSRFVVLLFVCFLSKNIAYSSRYIVSRN